jgi:hypothetical protein
MFCSPVHGSWAKPAVLYLGNGNETFRPMIYIEFVAIDVKSLIVVVL